MSDIKHHVLSGGSSALKHTGDASALVVTAGTMADYLPAIAAVFSIVWTAIRIYETSTVQKWLGRIPVEDGEG